jgi:CheY-like chemotaxis protein
MARILHVEDDPVWRDLTKDRLADHRVDSARSPEEALQFLQSRAPYDLALVDINLETDSDQRGGEVLDLLRKVYPNTRRIVITAFPPAGSVRENVFRRFEVEEIIIKRDFDTPDLRLIVEEALSQRSGELSRALKLQRSVLRQRYREWQRREA